MTVYDTYVFTNKDINILSNSSSGGAFYALSKYVIDNSGVVYGAYLDSNLGSVLHKRVVCKEDLLNILGAKYVFSNVSKCFTWCRDDLLSNKMVLFVGTPCQIAMLYKFLGSIDKTNLITVDFICHGAPKPNVWSSYLTYLKIMPPYDINFRLKKDGWENYYIKINNYFEKASDNIYMKLFLDNYILLDSCYECKFKGDNHIADITLGDAWGIKQYAENCFDKNGCSLVIIRRKKELTNVLLREGKLCKVSFESAINHNVSYYESPKKPLDFNKKQKLINKNKFKYIYNNWKTTFKRYVFRKTMLSPFYKKPLLAKKKYIGIITNYAFNKYNFGNRLQNFALSYKIKEYGLKPFNILIGGLNGPKYPLHRLYYNLQFFIHNNRDRNFLVKMADVKSGIKNTWINDDHHSINKLFKFPKVIYGGDQIWNPSWKPFDIRLGKYCVNTSNIKKYSYSSSVCIYSQNAEIQKSFIDNITSFRKVSLREIEAVDYFKGMNIEADLVCDPVLLYDANKWDIFVKKYAKTKKPKQQYILRYCLSQNSNKPEILIDNCVVDVLDKKSEFYNINQFDFVKLIKESKCVVTDSYHAILFCIIYKKDFILFTRDGVENGPSRFSSLFKTFRIDYEIDSGIIFNNWDKIQINIDPLISFSNDFIRNIITD